MGVSRGYLALKRFGEALMRQSEHDPRLARAASQGYDLLNPLVHGTKSDAIAGQVPQAFFATSQPEQALLYTGGGRRGGPGSPAKGGVLVPAVLRGPVKETAFSVDDMLPVDDLSWLRELGIDNPEEFRREVWRANTHRRQLRHG